MYQYNNTVLQLKIVQQFSTCKYCQITVKIMKGIIQNNNN